MNRAPETLTPTLLNENSEFAKYGPTLYAVLLAMTSAAVAPFVLFCFAWLQDPPFDKQTLNGAMAYSLLAATIPLLFAVLAIVNCVNQHAVAERFLRWSPSVCQAILKTANLMVWFCLPLLWFYTTLESFSGGKWYDSVGRLVFIGSMMILAFGVWQTYKQIRDFCSSCSDRERALGLGFWTRTMLAATVFVPVVLALLSAAGYHFTAVQLSWRFYWTLVIVVGIALLTSITSRMLLIMQFRAKLQQLRENVGSNQESTLDVGEITSQVNRLLRVVAMVAVVIVGWQLWSGVLPAISYLDNVQLPWTGYDEEGTPTAVTLRDLLLSVGILAITIVLSRNLPGILEIVLLDRLPLDRGGRHAISFVCRHVVGITGLLLMFRWLGFSWTTVQWLAAGLSVGLGFGLQEIFANLISGLIILIERPVRVGDFVTVNGISGHVCRMQLRATTIKDLDHRELIVPNKKFITEDVVNWTLSDRSTRVIIRVGIAYGSDTSLAQKLLMEVAKANPLVKNIPSPEVVFLSFGESSLDFELRVLISTREVYFRVIHELNMAVDSAFREAGLEIAFPQRDLHVRGLSLEHLGQSAKSHAEHEPNASSAPAPSANNAANAGQKVA